MSDSEPKERIEQSLYSLGIFVFARVRICELPLVLRQQIMLSEMYEILCLDTVTQPCSDMHLVDRQYSV